MFSETGLAGGRTAIHKDLGTVCRAGLPETSRSPTKRSASVQYLGQNNLEHQYGQGTSLPSSNSTENYLRSLVKTLNMSLAHSELH